MAKSSEHSTSTGLVLGDLVARTLSDLLEGSVAESVTDTANNLDVDLYWLWSIITLINVKSDYHIISKEIFDDLNSLNANTNDSYIIQNRPDRNSEISFISYRRKDVPECAAIVFDALSVNYGPECVFFDTYSMPIGSIFRREVRRRVAQSGVIMVIIGPNWIEYDSQSGINRMENPDDPVRIEIEAAIEYAKPLILIDFESRLIEALPELDLLKYLKSGSVVSLTHQDSINDIFEKIQQSVDEVLRKELKMVMLNFSSIYSDDVIAIKSLVQFANKMVDTAKAASDTSPPSMSPNILDLMSIDRMINDWILIRDPKFGYG